MSAPTGPTARPHHLADGGEPTGMISTPHAGTTQHPTAQRPTAQHPAPAYGSSPYGPYEAPTPGYDARPLPPAVPAAGATAPKAAGTVSRKIAALIGVVAFVLGAGAALLVGGLTGPGGTPPAGGPPGSSTSQTQQGTTGSTSGTTSGTTGTSS